MAHQIPGVRFKSGMEIDDVFPYFKHLLPSVDTIILHLGTNEQETTIFVVKARNKASLATRENDGEDNLSL